MTKAQESEQRFRHGCVLVTGGKVLALTCNASNRTVLAGRIMSSMHAEMVALSFAYRGNRNPRRMRHMDLYVVRLGNNDSMMDSKPCTCCVKALRKMGVKRVYYSCNAGTVRMEKVCDMKSTHLSFHQDAIHMQDYPMEKIRF